VLQPTKERHVEVKIDLSMHVRIQPKAIAAAIIVAIRTLIG